MTKPDLPMIADLCNLSGPSFSARLEHLRAELLPHLLAHEARGSTEVFEFPKAMLKELLELVAFEQRCCEELHWSVESGGHESVRLVVRGLPPGQSLATTLGTRRGG